MARPKKDIDPKKPAAKAKKPAAKKKTGRPLAKVDPKIVEALASVGCSGEEIATYLGVARSTIYARFRTVIEKGHTNQKISLRRKQQELANAGDRTMLIWLGKQQLGQSDKRDVNNTGNAAPLVADPQAVASELLRLKDYATFQRGRAVAEDSNASPVGTNGKPGPMANGTPPSNGRQGTNGTGGPNGHT